MLMKSTYPEEGWSSNLNIWEYICIYFVTYHNKYALNYLIRCQLINQLVLLQIGIITSWTDVDQLFNTTFIFVR